MPIWLRQTFGVAFCLVCANIVVGEGKAGRGCEVATPTRKQRKSGSARKNGTSRKRVQGSIFNRRGCATSLSRFRKLHLGRCGKKLRPSRPSLPHAAVAYVSYKQRCLAMYGAFMLFQLPVLLPVFHNQKSFCYAGEHIPKRSACEARPSGAVNRGKKGGKPG